MNSKISILRNIQNKKSGGFILSDKIDDTVAIVKKDNKHKYINQSQSSHISEMEIDNEKYLIEPFIPVKQERFIGLTTAESGEGKTLILSILADQYLKYYKNQRHVYYVCSTSIKEDINLKNMNIKQLDIERIKNGSLKIENLRNSLVIIDDADFHEDHKVIIRWMNDIVTLGRKFQTSLLYSSHIHSKLSESPIYKEISFYITFPNALINNRMIENNLKISEHIIQELIEGKNSFICFNKIYKSIVTDRIIMKY